MHCGPLKRKAGAVCEKQTEQIFASAGNLGGQDARNKRYRDGGMTVGPNAGVRGSVRPPHD